MGTVRIPCVVAMGGLSFLLSTGLACAQIRYLTVPTPKSPLPPGFLLPVTPAPATAPLSAPAPAPAPVQAKFSRAYQPKPSLDKDELEKRVVAFQQQRSEAGSPSAQYELGMRYAQGRGVDKDLGRARKWLKLSAAQGNTEAEAALAKLPGASKP